MGEELGTVYQCHLYGDGEPRKQRCWRWGRPCRGPEAQTPLGSSPSLSFSLGSEPALLYGSSGNCSLSQSLRLCAWPKAEL